MTMRTGILFSVLLVTCNGQPGDARAAAGPIRASLYPPHSHSTYRPMLTNHQVDCLWGFFCEGHLPLFHFATEDQLHRVGGWGRFAGLRHRGQIEMAFELFASSFYPVVADDGLSWSARALTDLQRALHVHGYTRSSALSHRVSRSTRGVCLAAQERSSPYVLLVVACWSGTADVEAIAMYDHASRAVAPAYLIRQVTAAMMRVDQQSADSPD